MGIRHFSGLFVLLCVGVTGALLTLAGEHAFYRLVLPHIRRRQKFKYWLHTSQKIHRALNMTYEDVKRQRANTEKSCNIQKSQPVQPPPPPAPGSFAKWNNESSRAAKELKDNKRVHFNLETLNTRRLLARVVAEGGQGASGSASRAGSDSGSAASVSQVSRVCENGGPVPLQPLPSSPPHSTDPPKDGELEELQEKIEEIRGQLREALARRAQLQTALAKERAAAVIPLTQEGPPTVTATICRSLVKDLEGKR